MKSLESTESTTQLGKDIFRFDSDSRVGHDINKLDKMEIDDGKVGGGKLDNEIGKKDYKTSKSKTLFKSKNCFSKKKQKRSDFLTLGAKLTFIKLSQIFFKASIFHYFDPERHI